MSTKRVTESISFVGCEFQNATRTINGVVLLSPVSKNGYRYLENAMRAAVPKYNTQVFISHPTKEELSTGRRDIMKLAGKVENARFESGKIKGDVRTLPDDYGRKFFDVAQMMPESAGCSHVADIAMGTLNGENVVEEIKEVLSVDLVANPATNAGVFESEQSGKRRSKINEDEAFDILTGENDEAEAGAESAFDAATKRDRSTDGLEALIDQTF